uniref:Protein kinase domain-containing protein n=1 Tax=Meloidogyne incognita TaxID=6306 RepID=A0A914LJQ6_MELIC
MSYLAAETFIRKILSKKTDVYSFGVLAWEIFENGKVPFKGLTDLDIARKVCLFLLKKTNGLKFNKFCLN